MYFCTLCMSIDSCEVFLMTCGLWAQHWTLFWKRPFIGLLKPSGIADIEISFPKDLVPWCNIQASKLGSDNRPLI